MLGQRRQVDALDDALDLAGDVARLDRTGVLVAKLAAYNQGVEELAKARAACPKCGADWGSMRYLDLRLKREEVPFHLSGVRTVISS